MIDCIQLTIKTNKNEKGKIFENEKRNIFKKVNII